MSVRLDSYRVFCEVAKKQSFSGAAKSLYMTQPAVSQIIMNLEQELNTRLFTRTSKGVNLTTDGQLLYEYISSAINLIEVGEKKLSEARDLMTGELKIGVGDTISRHYLLPYLAIFHNDSPNIKLRIINRTTMELCRILKSGEIDIAVCNLPVKDSALDVKECMPIHDIFVCGEKFKHLAAEPVSLELQSSCQFFLSVTNSRQYVEKFSSKGIKLQPEIELGPMSCCLSLQGLISESPVLLKNFQRLPGKRASLQAETEEKFLKGNRVLLFKNYPYLPQQENLSALFRAEMMCQCL